MGGSRVQQGGRKVDDRLTVVQLARFGDLIQTAPLLQNLRQEASELTLVVDQRVASVAKMLVGVDRVVGVDLSRPPFPISGRSLAENLQAVRDWASSWKDAAVAERVVLLNQGALPSFLARSIQAEVYDGPFNESSLPAPHLYLNHALSDRRFNPIHLVEIWAAYSQNHGILAAPSLRTDAGTPFAKHSGELARTPDREHYYAINVGAGAAGRRLRAEKLAELVTWLLKMGASRVDLLGTSADEANALNVLERLGTGDSRIRNLVGQTSIEQLLAVLADEDVLISADTGTLQLAAATPCRPLGLFFGGANPVETGPYCEDAVALVHQNSLQQHEDDVLDHAANLSMEQVAKLATKMSDQGNEVNEDDDAFNSFDLLVARPSSMGFRYRYLAREKRVQFGAGERWLPLLEALIHSNDLAPGKSFETEWGRVGDPTSPAALLKEVLEESSTSWMALEPAEQRWISGIVQAFAANGYLGLASGVTPKLEKSYDA